MALDSPQRTQDLLDLAVIHGEARYAELADGGQVIRSLLGSSEIASPRHTDLGFAQGGDGVYFIVLPIVHAGHNAELRLGFDEQRTQDRIRLAFNRMLWLLAGYMVLAVSVGIILSHRLSRPIQGLRNLSRAISSGNYGQHLVVSTGVRELHELAVDLEGMRVELVGINERLQAQIVEREISEGRREALQKQLRNRQRLETVGTLAGGIAHEINNVLVPIILFTDTVLHDSSLSPASRSDLERVLSSARRAKDVVKKMLTFSREFDNAKLSPVDLRAVVSDGLALFAALAHPGIEVRSQIDLDVPMVKADATLAVHLVLNLCTNAYQSMEGTDGVLTVGLKHHGPYQHPDETAGVELWVSDTGHGMDPATVERIFEPFFTTRSVGQGSGLGLSVVHGIVESFGGTISVETALGAGSTFRVFFPEVTDLEGMTNHGREDSPCKA